MRTPTRRVYSRLAAEDYQRLQHEAAARGESLMACIADCLREYFALRAELASAVAAPGTPGAPHTGLIHSLLARTEGRLAATLEAHVANLHDEHQRLESMVERFVQLYLVHTPDVARQLLVEAVASANRRYSSYLEAVSERLARNGPNGAGTADGVTAVARHDEGKDG